MSPQRPDVQIFALQVYAIYIGFHIYFTFLASLFELSKLVIWFLSLLFLSRSFYAGLQPVLSLVGVTLKILPVPAILVSLFAMAGTSDSGEASSSQSQMSQADPDDIFLNIQRASSIIKSIYFGFYSLSKGEFIKNVKDLGNEIELKFVRDMVTAIVRRRTGFTGNTVERKKCDGLKENLASDIYLMFAFGEGSIQSLPKHILKSDGRSTSDQSSQTNIDSYFAQKDELNALRVELM